MELFNLPVQKYWEFTKKYTPEQKKEEILNRINSGNYIGSEKIDGHYNRAVINDGELRMESRVVSVKTGEHNDKKFHVPHIAAALTEKLPDNTVIIGELYYPNSTSQDVGKILQCKPDKAIERQKQSGKLKYYIHDVWYYGGKSTMDLPYSERAAMVKEVIKPIFSKYSFITFPEYESEPKNILSLMQKVFDKGGEGIVLVDKESPVEPGKRTAWRTIKVKRELDSYIDCFFTGRIKNATKEYTGKEITSWEYWENLKTGEKMLGQYFNEVTLGKTLMPVTKNYFYNIPGSLEIGVMDREKVVPIGFLSGLADEIKANYKDYENKCCEVAAMMFTEDGNLRHPKMIRLRPDLNPSDCTLEKYWGNR